MILCIDGSNIRAGGGLTHLIELIDSANPNYFGFNKVILFSNTKTLNLIPDKSWLEKQNPPMLNKNLLFRTYWQMFKLSKHIRCLKGDILFIPGGSYFGKFQPSVTLSQNLLPFEFKELFRYKFSLMTFKLLLLRFTQSFSFKRSRGVIFLTNYAKSTVLSVTGTIPDKNIKIIPHGLNTRFLNTPRTQKSIEKYSNEYPFKIIYVSKIDNYKHQWNVVKAIADLRTTTKWPLELNLIGPYYQKAYNKLLKYIKIYDNNNQWVVYHGEIAFKDLNLLYANSDLGIFASTCENMPNILLEKMASGLPIACSSFGPMKEILGDFNCYFNPEDISNITQTLKDLIISVELRSFLANNNYLNANNYKWADTSNDTLKFISEIAKNNCKNE
jgi:glycosyltransferase involved in cell wall biosynthesis